MSRDYTEITDEQLRTINKRAIEQPSYEELREQNRVLVKALDDIRKKSYEPDPERPELSTRAQIQLMAEYAPHRHEPTTHTQHDIAQAEANGFL